jgi:hypothetical protein
MLCYVGLSILGLSAIIMASKETHAVTGKGDRFVTGLRDTIAWRVSSFHEYGGRSMDGVDYKRSVRTSVSPIILQPKSVAT